MVRGEFADADADHSHYPHQQNSVSAKPIVLAADGNVRLYHGDRYRHSIHASGKLSGLHGPADFVLAAVGAHTPMLRSPDTVGQNVAVEEKLDLTYRKSSQWRSLIMMDHPSEGSRIDHLEIKRH